MRILRIDHIAVCAPSVGEASELWRTLLPLQLGPVESVDNQKTDVAFLLTEAEADACIELISPQPGNVGLAKFLECNRGKAGLHHIAFLVDDIGAALDELAARGTKLIDRQARPGARGHLVAFLHPDAGGGVLIELVQASHSH